MKKSVFLLIAIVVFSVGCKRESVEVTPLDNPPGAVGYPTSTFKKTNVVISTPVVTQVATEKKAVSKTETTTLPPSLANPPPIQTKSTTAPAVAVATNVGNVYNVTGPLVTGPSNTINFIYGPTNLATTVSATETVVPPIVPKAPPQEVERTSWWRLIIPLLLIAIIAVLIKRRRAVGSYWKDRWVRLRRRAGEIIGGSPPGGPLPPGTPQSGAGPGFNPPPTSNYDAIFGGGGTPPPSGNPPGGQTGGTTPPLPSPRNGRNPGDPKPWLWILFWPINILLIILSYFLIVNEVSINGNNQLNYGLIILSIQLIYFVLSIKKVDIDEAGGILFFGKGLYTVDSGPRLVPFLICELRKVTMNTIQVQFPADPETVDKTGEDIVIPGKVFPIRVPTGSWDTVGTEQKKRLETVLGISIEDLKNDPINHRITPEVSMIVRFKVSRKRLLKFLVNLAGDIGEVIRQIRDTMETVVKNEYAKRTAPLIILDRPAIDCALLESVERLVGEKPRLDAKGNEVFDPDENWGIDVLDASVVDTDLGKTINTALKDIPAAELAREKGIIDADLEMKARIKKGQGEKSYLIDQGAGTASAEKAMLDALITSASGDPEKARLVALLLAQRTLKATDKVVIGGSTGDIMGLVAGINETLKSVNRPANNPPPPQNP